MSSMKVHAKNIQKLLNMIKVNICMQQVCIQIYTFIILSNSVQNKYAFGLISKYKILYLNILKYADKYPIA